MKLIEIIPLILTITILNPLFASCSMKPSQAPNVETISIYDEYSVNAIDLGLSKDETLMDIIEIGGEIRATVGIADMDEELDGIYRSPNHGTPRETEHRYYDANFEEDTAKREKTSSSHEVSLFADPAVDLVFGAEPYLYTQTESGRPFYSGVLYHFYQDGEAMDEIIIPEDMVDGNNLKFANYNAYAHFMLYENVIYASINYFTIPELYIADHFIGLPSWNPLIPEYQLCGLIGIDGIPFALVRVWETNRSEQIVDTLWEETRLVPLTPDMTELPMEGTKIDGKPTGGAFSDGTYGYFFCGSELWRTDGKESMCIADLIFCGVNETSRIRSLRRLSDGRILVVTDGRLIELTGTDGSSQEGKDVYTIGVCNLYGDISNLSIALSKFNGISENAVFKLKEFSDQSSLNLAMLSGEVSMVVSRDQFLLRNYVKQKLLVPLDTVAPELFEKNVLIENVVDAAKVDGVCYYLPRYFDIRGEHTDVGLLEEGQTFETRQEYLDFLVEKDPGYFKSRTKSTVFTTFGQDLDEWIDWESNTCHFDDGTFEALLEICNLANTTLEGTFLYDGALITQNFVLSDSVENNSFTDVAEAKAYWNQLSQTKPKEDEYVPERVWVKYPIPSAVYDGYEIYAPYFFAVVDQQASLEAAGNLLRWHFLEDVIDEFPSKTNDLYMEMFSVNKDETDRFLRRNIDGYMDTTPDPAMPTDVQAYERIIKSFHNMKCGKEQYDKTWEYIRESDHFQYFRNELFDVIYEEANRFFHNAITAKQAADYVQNRISLYLAEQG